MIIFYPKGNISFFYKVKTFSKSFNEKFNYYYKYEDILKTRNNALINQIENHKKIIKLELKVLSIFFIIIVITIIILFLFPIILFLLKIIFNK